MKNKIQSLIAIFIALTFSVSAQTFNGTTGAITDNNAGWDVFTVAVTGLPTTTSATFGVESAMIDITHTWDSDLSVVLQSPSGTQITLTSGNGGSGNNYNTTTFIMTAGTNITAGNAPFPGSYVPQGNLGDFNNGEDPNGTWLLGVKDGASGDTGTLDDWSVTFSATPATPTATPCLITDCSDATNIAALPYTDAGQTTCGGCVAFDETDGCGSMFMKGNDLVYTYTPAADGWVRFLAQTAETNAGAERGAAIFLLDDCPSVPTSNCLASSTVQYPANHGSPDIIHNLTAGQTYYIVVSNGPNPHVYNGDPCINFDLSVTDITQPNPTEEDCFGAQPICSGSITETTPGSGEGAYPSEINSSSSCLEGERNGKWYSFTAESTGTMTVLITPVTDTDDYDFALYNTTSGGCEGVFDGTSPEVSCNYEMVDTGGDTGIDSGVAENDFENTITVNAGETYMLYVSQWSVSTDGYTITLGGGADYIDDEGPELASVDQPDCAQNEVVVHFTENIDCSTFAADGSDFTLTDPGTLTITGASSAICTAGGTFTDQVTLTLSGNIVLGGTYTIGMNAGTISDQCSHTTLGTATVQFTIVTPTVTAGSNSPICSGQTLSLTETGGDADAWSWSGPNTFSSTNQNPNIAGATVAADGIYTVTGTITATSCASSNTVDVTVNALPTITPTATTPICDGQTLTLGETGGDATSWVWTSTSTWNPNDIQGPSLASATPAATGTYTVVGTDANSCSNTANVAVTVNALPAVNPTTNSPVCSGNNLTLGETGGDATSWTWTGTGSWNPADIQNPNQASALITSTGTYTVVVSDGTCSNTANIAVTVNDIPTVSAGGAAAICANQTYTLGGSYGGGASSILWTTSGDGSFNNATIVGAIYTPGATDISGGSVTLTITTDDPAGPCGSETDNMVLTINPMEDASFSYSSGTYCTTASDPSPTITGVGGGTFTSAPAGLSMNAAGVIDVSASTIGGPYTVTYTTPGTCSSSSTFDVTITSGADAQFTYTTPICNSGANPSPSHTTGSNGTYSSTAGLVFVNTSTGVIDLAATTPGTYTVTNTVNLGACGTDVQTFDITIDEAAQVFAGNNATVCESDGSYALSGATMGGSTSTITWSGGTGSFANANNINTNYVFGAGETGAVVLTVTTDNPAGSCGVVTDQITLTINDAAEVSAGANDAICEDETYTLSGTSGGATGNITWSTSGDGSFNDNTSLTAIYTPGPTDMGAITLTISSDDPAGPCGVVTSDMILTVNPLPTVTAGSNSPICQGTTLNLTESGGSATSWVWTGTGTYNPADVQNPSQAGTAVSDQGTFTVVGTITATGCSAQDVVAVTVNPTPTVIAGSNSPICENDQLDLTETGGDADSWVWTSSTSYDPDDIQNPIHTNSLPSESGNYTVTGEITATGCTAQDVVAVTVNALPVVVANADDNTVCEGTTVTLTGSGADTYTWLPVVTDGVAFTPSVGTTNYVVTGTVTATGCENTDNIDVIVSPMPTVSSGGNDAICENETYTLNGSYGGGASSITWTTSGNGTFDDNTLVNAVYTPGSDDITNGTVTLTITTDDPASDCNAVFESMVLTVNPLEDAQFSYSAGTFCITGANPIPSSIATVGGTFSGSAGLVIDGTTGSIDLTGTGIGGPFTVTYTTPGTCSNSSTFDVTITAGFDAEFYYDTPVCNDGTNPLPLHNTGSNGIYSSTAGLDFVNTGTGEIDFSTSTAGTYTVTNTIAAAGGCSMAQETFDITIDQSALVFAGNNDVVCEADVTYTLSNATQGGSTPSVLWTTSGDGTFGDATDINATYTFGATDIGTTVTLTVTTGDPGTSCGVNSDDVDITIDQAPTVDAGLNDSICAGETYMLSGILGGSTSNITWSTSGDGTFDDENILTATYTPGATDITNQTVTLTITSNTNGTCLADTDDMVLRIDPLPVIVAGANTPLCEGQQLDLTETGGDADAWVWTGTGTYDPNDEQNPTLGSVYMGAAGTYTVVGTITATGCFDQNTVDVVVQAVPAVTAGVVTNPVCARENVELTETGTEADAWSWTATNGYTSSDNNPTIFNATADTSGWYYVTGTITATGCSAIDSVEITVNALPTVSYTVLANDTVCLGETVTLTGTGTATTYTWNNSVNNGVAFIPTATNTYTVVGEDANACKDSVMVQVVVNSLPPVYAGIDQTVPYGGTTTINDASPTGLTYSWTPADSLVDATILQPTTIPLHIFNQFILEGTDPITGCSTTDTMDITVVGGPLSVQLFASPNDSICSGEAHYIYAIPSGGVGDAENFTYTWADDLGNTVYPNSDTLLLDTVMATRTYSLTVTDEGVGVVNSSITITVMDLPVISSVVVTDLLCNGDNSGQILINATGDNPLGYSINGGTTFVNDSLFDNMSIGTDFYTAVQTPFGCIVYGDTVDVAEPNTLIATEGTITDANCGNNNGEITVDVTGGTLPYTFSWSDTGSTLDSIAAGDYTVTVVDFNGCQTTLDYTIANAGGGYLVVDNVVEVDCYGESTGSIRVIMRDGFPSFDFYTMLGTTEVEKVLGVNDSIYEVTGLPAETYTVTAYEGAGCVSTIDVTISENPQIVISPLSTGLTCWNSGDGMIDLTTTGGVSPYTYTWTGTASTASTVLLLGAGFYDVTVTDSKFCNITYSNIEVTQPGAPDVNIGVQSEYQCFGFEEGQITAVGIGGTLPYTYKWTNASWTENGQVIDSLAAGDYQLLLTDANDCVIADSTVTLYEYPQMILTDSIVYEGTKGAIYLTAIGGTPAYTYEWTDLDLVNVSNDSYVENLITGTYMVTVSDFYGCSVYGAYDIDVPFLIPTLITPNADGYNDTWQIGGIEAFDNIFIEVYNRWGNIVFTYTGSGYNYGELSNQFDGTFNGSELPLGAYVYILDLKNGKEPFNGIINIVRTK